MWNVSLPSTNYLFRANKSARKRKRKREWKPVYNFCSASKFCATPDLAPLPPIQQNCMVIDSENRSWWTHSLTYSHTASYFTYTHVWCVCVLKVIVVAKCTHVIYTRRRSSHSRTLRNTATTKSACTERMQLQPPNNVNPFSCRATCISVNNWPTERSPVRIISHTNFNSSSETHCMRLGERKQMMPKHCCSYM